MKTDQAARRLAREQAKKEKYYLSSQWQLMGRKLRKHKLAMISAGVLIFLYLVAAFGDFIAPQGLEDYSARYSNAPPSKIHFMLDGKLTAPYVYKVTAEYDEYENKTFVEDTSQPYPISFFVKGSKYKLFGIFESDIHLFGINQPANTSSRNKVSVMIFGADKLGRDLFSRIVLGSQVSLTVPLLGTMISFVLAVIIGGVSGYYGGWVDMAIQRIIEVISSFPTLPLWMALSAAIPVGIPVTQVFIIITIIMSLLSWPGLARTVRSKFLSLKREDFVLAARLAGVKDKTIIRKHLVPGFMSYLIVDLTLGVPGMIIGETSMSFLGLGMRAPATSWGVLLQECQSLENIANCPWKLIPVLFVMLTVLGFNFLGDGLRDAADPYK